MNSCLSKEENYLDKGLTELKNHKVVNKFFIDGFGIKKLGVLKVEDTLGVFKLIFLLNGDVKKNTVENYSINIKVKYNNEKLGYRANEYLSFRFMPILVEKNGHKYIIKEIDIKSSKIEEISLVLQDREMLLKQNLSEIIKIKHIFLK